LMCRQSNDHLWGCAVFVQPFGTAFQNIRDSSLSLDVCRRYIKTFLFAFYKILWRSSDFCTL